VGGAKTEVKRMVSYLGAIEGRSYSAAQPSICPLDIFLHQQGSNNIRTEDNDDLSVGFENQCIHLKEISGSQSLVFICHTSTNAI
jgi:hypothetical protein